MSNQRQMMWHFSNGREAYGKRREIKTGGTLRVRGKLILCHHGLHASERVLDALRYAEGNIVSRVTLGRNVLRSRDKQVSTTRKHHQVYDATDVLSRFTAWCTGLRLLLDNRKSFTSSYTNSYTNSYTYASAYAYACACADAKAYAEVNTLLEDALIHAMAIAEKGGADK